MVRINLLPWREERRKQREKQFYMILLSGVAAGVLASLFFWSYLNGQISGQQDRNQFMKDEIAKVEKQLSEIKDLEEKKSALLNRKQVIEELQANRFQMVHLFDSLMRNVPEGLVLTGLKQEGDQLTLEGRAQSNARVASFMRSLESSGWMKNPDVSVIEATRPEGASSAGQGAAAGANTPPKGSAADLLPYMFTLRVQLANPNAPADPNAPPTPDPVVTQAPAAEPPPAAAAQPAMAPAPAAAPANGSNTPTPAAAAAPQTSPASQETQSPSSAPQAEAKK